MIGAIIITHGGLAQALLDAAIAIAGKADRVLAICVEGVSSGEDIKKAIGKGVKDMDDGDGVIIFTDMFGGTPTNIALSFLEEGRIEIITGVNLPLIIKFLNWRDSTNVSSIASGLVTHGHKSIALASSMLKKGG